MTYPSTDAAAAPADVANVARAFPESKEAAVRVAGTTSRRRGRQIERERP